MTPVEKRYTEESNNRGVMILRPEGKFYRLYERSAFLFCKTVREFKPTKRFYKNIGQEVVSIGFPRDAYLKHIGNRAAAADVDGTVSVQSCMEIDDSLFESWKQSIPLTSAKEIEQQFVGDRIQVYRESYALMTEIFISLQNASRDFKKIPGEDIRNDAVWAGRIHIRPAQSLAIIGQRQ